MNIDKIRNLLDTYRTGTVYDGRTIVATGLGGRVVNGLTVRPCLTLVYDDGTRQTVYS